MVGVVLNSVSVGGVAEGLPAEVRVVAMVPQVVDAVTTGGMWRPQRYLDHPVLGPVWAGLARACAGAFDPGGTGRFPDPS